MYINVTYYYFEICDVEIFNKKEKVQIYQRHLMNELLVKILVLLM